MVNKLRETENKMFDKLDDRIWGECFSPLILAFCITLITLLSSNSYYMLEMVVFNRHHLLTCYYMLALS